MLRLHNLISHLAFAANGVCPLPFVIPDDSIIKNVDILKDITSDQDRNLNSLLNKKGSTGSDSTGSLIDALKSTSDFIDQVTTSRKNDFSWLDAFRFSPILSQPPLSPESPKWTLAIARLVDRVTTLLTEADEQSNLLHILNQLSTLVIAKGNHWLVVLRRLTSNSPSDSLPNSEFLDADTMNTLINLLDNPKLILSQTTKKYAAMKIVNQAPSSSSRSHMRECDSTDSPCKCIQYTVNFSFTIPSKTATCLHSIKSHGGTTNSRFLLQSDSDLSATIHTDTQNAVLLEYGYLRIGLLLEPVLRARKSLDVLRISSNTFYFPEEIYKDITVNCMNWGNRMEKKRVEKSVTSLFTMYAGQIFTYDNCMIHEVSGMISHLPLKLITTSSNKNPSLILRKLDKNYLDLSKNLTTELLFKAADVKIDEDGLLKLKEEISGASRIEEDFTHRLTQAERFSFWKDFGQYAFHLVLSLGVAAICLAILIPLSREYCHSMFHGGCCGSSHTPPCSHKAACGVAGSDALCPDSAEAATAEIKNDSKSSVKDTKIPTKMMKNQMVENTDIELDLRDTVIKKHRDNELQRHRDMMRDYKPSYDDVKTEGNEF